MIPSLLDFGGDPTCQSSSHGAIMDMLRTHQNLILPPGMTFEVDEPIVPPAKLHQWGIFGFGSLHGATLRMRKDVDAPIIDAPHSSRVAIQNLTLTVEVLGHRTAPLMRLQQPYQSTLTNVYTDFADADSIVIGGEDGGSCVHLDHVVTMHSGGRGLVLINMADFSIYKGSSEYNKGGGLHIVNTKGPRVDTMGTVAHFRMEGNNQYALLAERAQSLEVHHNFVYSSDIIFDENCDDTCQEYNNRYYDADFVDNR